MERKTRDFKKSKRGACVSTKSPPFQCSPSPSPRFLTLSSLLLASSWGHRHFFFFFALKQNSLQNKKGGYSKTSSSMSHGRTQQNTASASLHRLSPLRMHFFFLFTFHPCAHGRKSEERSSNTPASRYSPEGGAREGERGAGLCDACCSALGSWTLVFFFCFVKLIRNFSDATCRLARVCLYIST